MSTDLDDYGTWRTVQSAAGKCDCHDCWRVARLDAEHTIAVDAWHRAARLAEKLMHFGRPVGLLADEQIVARDRALDACAERIAFLLAEVDEWTAAGQQIVDLFDPLKARVGDPSFMVLIAKAARQAHLDVRTDRDHLRTALDLEIGIAVTALEDVAVLREALGSFALVLDVLASDPRAALVAGRLRGIVEEMRAAGTRHGLTEGVSTAVDGGIER